MLRNTCCSGFVLEQHAVYIHERGNTDSELIRGQPIVMGFLPETITAEDQSAMSPFTEYIIMVTISGRALSHRHQSLAENVYINTSQDFWGRHQWISTDLTERMQNLSLKYAPASEQADPLLLFTNMVAQTTVLYLYKIMNSMTPATAENQAVMMDYQRCSLVAAQEMVNLAKTLVQLSCFKVSSLHRPQNVFLNQQLIQIHPFTPIPLSLCAEYLNSYRDLDDSFASQLQHILGALRGLKRFNNLAQGCLHLYESQSIDGFFQNPSNNLDLQFVYK